MWTTGVQGFDTLPHIDHIHHQVSIFWMEDIVLPPPHMTSPPSCDDFPWLSNTAKITGCFQSDNLGWLDLVKIG